MTGSLLRQVDAIPVIDYPGGGSAIEFLTTIDVAGFPAYFDEIAASK